ncbi:hypothetical protein LIER_23286 [Lithospermum erythrorhizon]|uniref:Secreted protein n=1 Tax=Lithospermum erythrorhizon TaxID=34254 RepID=A0AAV3QX48_LITER
MVLYRKSFQGLLLRCVTREVGLIALEEVHGGMCKSHINVRSLTQKIICLGVFWPLIATDANDHGKRCDSCQRQASIPHQPPHEMVMPRSWNACHLRKYYV